MTVRTVVVGAGAAGVPLATRLAQDPGRRVLLLEAGPADSTPTELRDGGRLPGALPGHSSNWEYDTRLVRDRMHTLVRGRLVGGSSTINGGYFVRATSADFERWAAIGGPEWRFDRALPVLREMERDLDFVESELHGSNGPMPVTRPKPTGLINAFIAAANELGFTTERDKNAGAPPGAGPVPSNILGGERVNTSIAYLETADHGVEVRGGTRATRVIIERGRAVGVETQHGHIEADEVILTAGAIATPQLLMLSGIGPAAHLRDMGIPVAADLPVGVAFSDHPNLALGFRTRRSVVDWEATYGFPAALNFDASARIASRSSASSEGDLEILLAAKPLEYLLTGRRDDGRRLHTLIALQQHPNSGHLTLRSADPRAAPHIEHNYLTREEDRRRMRVAVRTAAELLSTRSFSEIVEGLIDLDDATLQDDEALDTWVIARLGTALHMCGTAPMGSVVDGAGQVRGIAGLRVADTSILPTAPRRGPANTAVFLGEFIARRMLRDN